METVSPHVAQLHRSLEVTVLQGCRSLQKLPLIVRAERLGQIQLSFSIAFPWSHRSVLEASEEANGLHFMPNNLPNANVIVSESEMRVNLVPYHILWRNKEGIHTGQPAMILCLTDL